MTYKIKEIYVGSESELQKKNKTYKTSYKKQPISGSQYVNFEGLEEDNQSDKEVHGGVQRALCVFTQGSYDFFKKKHNINLPTCALGENITLLDCDDKDICLGDRFSCGEAVFEVSQPRQPCWIISSILGIKKLTALIVKEGRSGFYLRVIKEGKICKEDEFKLQIRKYEKLNIEYINKCYYNAKENHEEIKEILEVPELSPFYRDDLLKRYKNKEYGLESFQKDKE